MKVGGSPPSAYVPASDIEAPIRISTIDGVFPVILGSGRHRRTHGKTQSTWLTDCVYPVLTKHCLYVMGGIVLRDMVCHLSSTSEIFVLMTKPMAPDHLRTHVGNRLSSMAGTVYWVGLVLMPILPVSSQVSQHRVIPATNHKWNCR